MKTIIYLFLASSGMIFSGPCHGASLVIDSFSDGTIAIGSGGSYLSPEVPIASDVVTTRGLYVAGSIDNWDWRADLNPPPGSFFFNADRLQTGGRVLRLSLNYDSTSSFSLSGYRAFELDLRAVTGKGLMEIIIASSDASQRIQVSIDSPGTVSYPFENLAASSLESLNRLSVHFFPEADDFSFTLDEIRVVPEPSGSLMVVLGIILGVSRRRR